MNLTAAGLLATTFSFVAFITAAVWYAVPWMRRQPVEVALILPLWIQAFRYVALQIFSARHFGFDVPLAMAHEIAWGDVAGASLALIALWLLRYRSRLALVVVWLLVIETVADLTNAVIQGIGHHASDTAHDITWVILNMYAPMLWVSLGLLVWRLLAQHGHAMAKRSAPVADPQPVSH